MEPNDLVRALMEAIDLYLSYEGPLTSSEVSWVVGTLEDLKLISTTPVEVDDLFAALRKPCAEYLEADPTSAIRNREVRGALTVVQLEFYLTRRAAIILDTA